ncbi:antiviral reverse transcriptase Drt3a [Aeromicrobium fastidiosum]|uniref:RNA-directed DNA polymerase n=1 Tax=Aeromicrobium fastidiosum TaxID=52699 RepID=A0A641APH7_9ACTN|nr:antiviral reverse transcriptase Drt3a [Aeromicrobium fastidiosum]KAA1379990.1 RNA-directed DNA polymerase [Aeromicrobium fastidiosum]MBP2389510.1 hypothetical protein [Aeromicrobium fastidiosum]
MADQSYSAANFRRIWDLRTRRGEDLSTFYPAVQDASNQIRVLVAERREDLATRTLGSTDYEDCAASHDVDIKTARRKRDELLVAHLSGTSLLVNQQIDADSLSLKTVPGPVVRGKPTYTLPPDDPITYFLSRQSERNVRLALSVEAPSRSITAEQLFRTIDNQVPLMVLRTDLASFYESIPHDRLRAMLRSSDSLSRTTCRVVDSMLAESENRTGKPIGLPRGLALSAALAEAYAKQLDLLISKSQSVYLYVRYVDDIVLVLGVADQDPKVNNRLKAVSDIVHSLGLSLNPAKTFATSRPKASEPAIGFDFLGYRLTLSHTGCTADLTRSRADRYLQRLQLTFDQYRNEGGTSRSAVQLLQRLRFLTGNTRLANNKRQGLVGIYFSNSLLPGRTQILEELDAALDAHVASVAMPPAVLMAAKEMSFCDGFEKTIYHRFSSKQLRQIVRIWKFDDKA